MSSALESTLALLHKSYYKRLYDRLIKVVKVFTQHLSQYYCTTGLPQTQVFSFKFALIVFISASSL